MNDKIEIKEGGRRTVRFTFSPGCYSIAPFTRQFTFSAAAPLDAARNKEMQAYMQAFQDRTFVKIRVAGVLYNAKPYRCEVKEHEGVNRW